MKNLMLVSFVIALLLPSAIAFNCNSLSGGDFNVCKSIQETNLTQIEKDLLISDLFNKNKSSPNFDFVYSWNTNLKIDKSPDNKYENNGAIRNAWVKIIAVMPSVLDENVLYVSDQGKILTRFNYDVVLPSVTESGDCKTTYSLKDKNENLEIYVNGKLIGNQELTGFLLKTEDKQADFLAKLNLEVKYEIKHYRKNKYCSEYKDGKCVKYKSVCEYSFTNYQTDKLTLIDSLSAKHYKCELNSSFKITENNYGITYGTMQADNFTKLNLIFNNSLYQYQKYIYSLNYSSQYYILTTKAVKSESASFDNIHVDKEADKFYFTVKDTSNCKIELFDHFNSVIKNCDLSYNPINFSIRTDKTNYYENDTIKVYIFPENVQVNLSYANQSITAKNYTEFKSVLYENQITGKINDQEISVLANVNKREDVTLLYNIGALSFLGYFFYRFFKTYYFKLNSIIWS